MNDNWNVAPCGLLVTGAHGEIVEANRTLCVWLGFGLDELRRAKLQDFLTVGSRLFHHTQWMPLLQMQGSLAEVQLELVTKDGKVLPVLVNATKRESSELVDIALLIVADRRRYERQLLDARKLAETMSRKLEEKNRELESFAYTASHDLKAPLRAVSNLAKWIREDEGERLGAASRENLVLMESRLAHMNALIDAMLSIARAGITDEAPTTVSVRELLEGILRILEVPSNMSIELGALPLLRTSRIALEQVFLNLVSNAFKYVGREDGLLKIDATEEGDRFRFRVSDNGPGIAPQHHERIWKIFQALDPKRGGESTGVGLAIVKKRVEQRGGRVWLESAVGRGATFYFTWPKDEGQ